MVLILGLKKYSQLEGSHPTLSSPRHKSLASEITNWSTKPLYDWDQEVQDSAHHGSLVTHENSAIYQVFSSLSSLQSASTHLDVK